MIRSTSSTTLTNTGFINAGSGVDTINLSLRTVSATSVYGGAGNDSIVVSGTTDNGGNLSTPVLATTPSSSSPLVLSTLSGATIDGGAGADSINVGAVSAGADQLWSDQGWRR